ncbi:serine hydrolase domain-containing protein [Aquimarina pacifica]|uniref:serine hydrolase domain-containing protein n=1 Tax=Aquimarina pacifica TaxID=1296415 RepID=UPI00046EC1D6|nr:serine hydrolase [Aquimarina pacifica]
MKIFLLLAVFSSTFLMSQNKYTYSIPSKINDGWDTEDIMTKTSDATLLYRLFNQLNNGKHKLHSTLIVKDDKIILEEYFDKNTIETKHDMRSATKSVISIAIGIAIDKGIIASIDDPILKYLHDISPNKNIDKRKEKITIRHLLTMSPGLDCNDWDKQSKGQEDKVYKKNNWLQYTLDLPVINEPGTTPLYCSMGTVLAAEVISQASGMSFEDFVNMYLFTPLGIKNVHWGHTSKRKEIISSAKRLYMTSRDMAKIGKLIVQNGQWNSNQIVSQQWIENSTAIHTKLKGIEYGFLWWKIPFKVAQNKIMATIASGNGGQYIMIFKELNMIAVFTGGAYNSQEGKLPYAIVNDIYLPTFVNTKNN